EVIERDVAHNEGRVREAIRRARRTGDEPELVAANRDLLQAYLPDQQIHWLEQVHGTEVITRSASLQCAAPVADAQICREPNQALMIMTADCLPVLFCSADGAVIAAAHAGWRGLAAGILEKTIAAMAVEPADILAWFGPAISQKHFEVGLGVRAAFCQSMPEAEAAFIPNDNDRWQADLTMLARLRLAESGVEQVFGLNACTFADSERFFSYRRENPCGRMASFITRQDAGIA
ncbi:MAG: peptidoglycan editing factor PgeF, partial [Pseudomonadota bacterium]